MPYPMLYGFGIPGHFTKSNTLVPVAEIEVLPERVILYRLVELPLTPGSCVVLPGTAYTTFRVVRLNELLPPHRTWFVPIFHGLVLSTFIVEGLNATGYLPPPLSVTRKYE